MFTGYINHSGKILSIENLPQGKRFRIACNFPDLTQGESVSVNGACLTVTYCTPEEFHCDLSPETLAVTTLNDLKPGSKVNLERPLHASDRLHGHFVLGHVDQICHITAKNVFADYTEYSFGGVSAESTSYLVKKGSIAINGVSLTLNIIKEDTFTVMLIPETLRKTNLSTLELGDKVNIEYDYLAKIIVGAQPSK